MKFKTANRTAVIAPAPAKPTRTSGRDSTFTAGVVVPAAEAVITGILFASLIIAVISLRNPGVENRATLWSILWLAGTTVAWIGLLLHSRRLLENLEARTGLDLNSDGYVGAAPKPRRVILFNKRRAEDIDEANEQQFREGFRHFVSQLPARGTAMDAWEKTIGRETYQAYRDALFAEGYAGWTNGKNDRNGWRLLATVDEVLTNIREF